MSLHYYTALLFYSLRKEGVVGPGLTRSLLEIGEQNWYNDVPPEDLNNMAKGVVADAADRDSIGNRLDEILAAKRDQSFFEVAKLFYEIVLGKLERHAAIDFHGTPLAQKLDLNYPLPMTEQFDVVFNGGTAEHVFNAAQVFKSIHERTKPGGLMIHDLPNQGWHDHGFYNFHPTFCFDLAAANRYQIVCLPYYPNLSRAPEPWILIPDPVTYVRLAVEKKLGPQSSLIPVFRKPPVEAEFKAPQQGYYDNRLPPDLMAAWQQLR